MPKKKQVRRSLEAKFLAVMKRGAPALQATAALTVEAWYQRILTNKGKTSSHRA